MPILALTATATNTVINDTLKILQLPSQTRRFRSSVDRANLFYEVKQKGTSASQLTAMAKLIGEKYPRQVSIIFVFYCFLNLIFLKNLFFHRSKVGIIYCFSRNDCETVADKLGVMLAEKGIACAA